jgi:arabinogalactan oligomer/maltooligosaccharide transport system substrate-binding protein
MPKTRLFVVTLMVVATMILSACAPSATPVAPANTAVPQPQATAVQAQPTAVPPTAVPPAAELTITFWTKEGEADGGYQYVKGLTDAYTAAHPNVKFDVVNKNVETLREDFQTTSLAGQAPDLLWTVADHVGPFTAADLIQPTDDLLDLSVYVDSAVAALAADGKHWGVPVSNGNHLMLLYNKDLVPTAPKNSDELITVAKANTDAAAGTYGLVFNQTESFWLVPFLGGFGGSVFAADGKTPTLDTDAMKGALQFMYDLKYTDKVMPAEADYNGADTLFKDGKAAMIINGDWSLGGYKEALGDKLGVAPIPMIKSTGLWPAPYTAGAFFMLPKPLAGDKLTAVVDFLKFATDQANQVDMVKKLSRLPALKVALADPIIANDPLLAGSAEQMTHGTPQPTNLEMRCVFDAMTGEVRSLFTDQHKAEEAAKAMQEAAVSCIAAMGE